MDLKSGNMVPSNLIKRYETKDFVHEKYDVSTKEPKIDGMTEAFKQFLSEMKIK